MGIRVKRTDWKSAAWKSKAWGLIRGALARVAPAVLIVLSVAPTEAQADRVRWTVQSVTATTEQAAALEARIATMTWGEMRLKAFEPGALSAPNDLYRSVSIGAVDAALVDEATWFETLDAPPEAVEITRDRLQALQDGMGALTDRLRRDDVLPVLCGMDREAATTGFSLLLVHLPHHRRLDKSQTAILEAACAVAVLEGLAASRVKPAD
jgi:hypothetical protein